MELTKPLPSRQPTEAEARRLQEEAERADMASAQKLRLVEMSDKAATAQGAQGPALIKNEATDTPLGDRPCVPAALTSTPAPPLENLADAGVPSSDSFIPIVNKPVAAAQNASGLGPAAKPAPAPKNLPRVVPPEFENNSAAGTQSASASAPAAAKPVTVAQIAADLAPAAVTKPASPAQNAPGPAPAKLAPAPRNTPVPTPTVVVKSAPEPQSAPEPILTPKPTPATQSGQHPAPNSVAKAGAPPVKVRAPDPADLTELRPIGLVPLEVLHLEVSDLIRRKRNLFLLRVFLFIAVPTLIVTGYVFFYATPRYVSEFQAIYHSNDPQMQSSMLGGLLGGGSGSVDMNAAVIAYLESPAALAEANKQLNLRREFSSPGIDWLDRLSASAQTETFLSYFQRRISAYENSAGYVVVDAEAFSPSEAQKLAQTLASLAERMVASISQREKLNMVKFTEDEVQRCEREYLGAVDRLTKFREKHKNYDFSGSEQLLTGTVGSLESQLANLKSQLGSQRKFLADDAPSVAVIKSQIYAVESQISDERARLASSSKMAPSASSSAAPSNSKASSAPFGELPNDNITSKSLPYSEILATYFKLTQDQQFATALLQTAKQAAENARLEAGKQSAYMFTFVPPSLPQHSTEPSPMRYIVTTFVGCMLVYFAASVLFGLFRHESGI